MWTVHIGNRSELTNVNVEYYPWALDASPFIFIGLEQTLFLIEHGIFTVFDTL